MGCEDFDQIKMALVQWQNIAGRWIFGSVKGGKCFVELSG